MKKPLSRFLSLCAAASVLLISAQANAITLDLAPTNNPNLGFGYKGLYLGPDFSNGKKTCNTSSGPITTPGLVNPCLNWAWDNVTMDIASNGDALISGTMTRDFNNEIWGINIQLSDIEFRKKNGGYKKGANYNGSVTEQMFIDLTTGINPFNGKDHSSHTGWGFEWKTLNMTLDKMGNSSSVPTTGWQGFAMPNIGHNFVAELHYDGNGLFFDAWYKNPTSTNWYRKGDSKALASVRTTAVSEPSAFLLMGLGLIGLGLNRRSKK